MAWLASLITGAWTAFEILAGDLWVRSVNAQPQYLAGLTGDRNRIAKLTKSQPKPEQNKEGNNRETQDGEEKGEDKKLPSSSPSKVEITLGQMSEVKNCKYDLADKMGTLLVAAKRVDFISLAAIREAYSLAFPRKVKSARSSDIDLALADKSLNALSAVRNLIVHQAGIADNAYADDCKGAPSGPATMYSGCPVLNKNWP